MSPTPPVCSTIRRDQYKTSIRAMFLNHLYYRKQLLLTGLYLFVSVIYGHLAGGERFELPLTESKSVVLDRLDEPPISKQFLFVLRKTLRNHLSGAFLFRSWRINSLLKIAVIQSMLGASYLCPEAGLEPAIALLLGKCLNHLNYSGSRIAVCAFMVRVGGFEPTECLH